MVKLPFLTGDEEVSAQLSHLVSLGLTENIDRVRVIGILLYLF